MTTKEETKINVREPGKNFFQSQKVPPGKVPEFAALRKKKTHQVLEKIQQFWVGLLDGDGSIQCNHWKKKGIQYRFCIKLKQHPENEKMLRLISQYIGGTVRPTQEKNKKGQIINCVLWVENHRRRIQELNDILHKYPPISSKSYCQWQFLLKCQEKESVQWLLKERPNKYKNLPDYIARVSKEKLSQREYWPLWCSGFIEAQGCFSLPSNLAVSQGTPSFSIAQKNDAFLIQAIREYFAGINKVRSVKGGVFHWQVYRRIVLANIKMHLENYPLLGEKRVSAERFYAYLHYLHHF